jgi:hypothetical protein
MKQQKKKYDRGIPDDILLAGAGVRSPITHQLVWPSYERAESLHPGLKTMEAYVEEDDSNGRVHQIIDAWAFRFKVTVL